MGTSLTDIAEEKLEAARAASSGRSSHTVLGGRGHTLQQMVIALAAGFRLDDHENPGEATVQVIRGRVRLAPADADHGEVQEGTAGDLLVVPEVRHLLEAVEDAAVLLTLVRVS